MVLDATRRDLKVQERVSQNYPVLLGINQCYSFKGDPKVSYNYVTLSTETKGRTLIEERFNIDTGSVETAKNELEPVALLAWYTKQDALVKAGAMQVVATKTGIKVFSATYENVVSVPDTPTADAGDGDDK